MTVSDNNNDDSNSNSMLFWYDSRFDCGSERVSPQNHIVSVIQGLTLRDKSVIERNSLWLGIKSTILAERFLGAEVGRT